MNLNKYIALLSFLVLLGCKNTVPPFEPVELDPKVVIHFSLVNGEDIIEVGDNFTDGDNWNLTLRTLKFYLADMALISGGVETTLSDVELVDLSGTDETSFKRSYTYIIPKGEYDQLRLSIGLPSTLNATDPTTMTADDPLSLQGGMYWDWATMYVFIMMEAGIDTDFDAVIDDNIAFHTGLDTLFRPEQSYPMTFDIPAYAKDTLFVDIDWNEIYHPTDGTPIDLSATPFFHANVDEEALAASRVFTDNFIKSIHIRRQ